MCNICLKTQTHLCYCQFVARNFNLCTQCNATADSRCTYQRNVQIRRRNTSRNGGEQANAEHCSNGAAVMSTASNVIPRSKATWESPK